MQQQPDELTLRVRNHLLNKPQLLFFHSRSCQLCQSMSPAISQLSQQQGLPVSRICADDDQSWAAEVAYRDMQILSFAMQMLQYSVDKVPCLVLLNSEGGAVARTGEPVSRDRMMVSLQAMGRLAPQLKQ